ncbi:membrane cofactor protein-like isoform X4 [Phyllostomus hastatus]|uniref:membrane cofactor protein-like isoform X4 n=1 Tax=Phyllostomus hastatus TaxID=9423 RepID=UPI001E681F4B|nr:membrane cofactor protein-like isoform X4 [Phyllostomus hastatus]
MTASCGSRRIPARRPESSFSCWSFVGILLVVLLPTSTDACGAPPRYESMMLKGGSNDVYQPGDTVEYQCRPGYIPILPRLPVLSVCRSDNTWEPLQEACSRKPCPQLPDPLNGQVSGNFQFGSEAHYTCNNGYHLVGEATLYCELSGNTVDWSADPPQCEKILCRPPKQIENGITNTQKESYEYNEVVIYSCASNIYSLIGNSTLICTGHDLWSSNPPECKVVRCKSPVPKNGQLLSGHKVQFSYQDKVLLGCKEGFHPQGSKTVVCGANSEWEPQPPECISVPTPPSTTPPVSTVTGPVTSAKPPSTSHPGPVTSAKPPSTSHPGPAPGPSTLSPPTHSPPADALGAGGIAAIVISVVAVIAIIGGGLLSLHKKKKGCIIFL